MLRRGQGQIKLTHSSSQQVTQNPRAWKCLTKNRAITGLSLYYLAAEQDGYTNRSMPGEIRKGSKQISNREALVTVTD